VGGGEAVPGEVKEISTAVAARTPVPTPTPGRIELEIEEVTAELGVSGKTFLGITTEDWINLAISAVFAFIIYFVGVYLLTFILKWITQRTSNELDNTLLEQMEPDLRWLVFLFLARNAILRLDFLSDALRKSLEDLFFVLFLVTFTVIGLRLIKYGAEWYRDSISSDPEKARLDPIISAVRRSLAVVWLIVMISIGLTHFGINLGVLSITVLALAVIFSLGAKDTISDAISGFVILVDQPFRVNDGIQITEFDTWGDVIRIGMRKTQILTRDNREVIIPNTKLLDSRIINYTYPDPSYRMQVDLRIAFDADLEKARQVIINAVMGVDVVLPDKPVEALYIGFGDTARHIRVRWWVADYHMHYPMLDHICTAIDAALNRAGIEIHIETYDLNVAMKNGLQTADDQTGGPH
jgi:MscS family membrane protein